MKVGILLIHGLTGAPTEMRYLGSYLSSQGYEVENPLLPGHGAGTKELFATSAEALVRGSVEAFRSLQSRCEKVFIVGMCAGALIAALVAATDLRVAGIVLLAPYYGTISPNNSRLRHILPLVARIPWFRKRIFWSQGPSFGVKDTRLQMLIGESIKASEIKDTCDRGMFVTYVESFYQFNRLAKMVRARAKEVVSPALFIHSLEDTWFAPENSSRLAKDLGATDKTVLLISGCHHVITIDLERRYVAEQVAFFVKSHSSKQLRTELSSAA